MIHINLLGGVSAIVDGSPVGGEAAQRRRLSLLALLAAPPARALSRDRIIGLLWPENETESARHLLSASVHVLRKALGAESLTSTNDDVGLRPGAAIVDASEFRDAVKAGEFERAVELYRGPFLDGVYISGAPEFEQWVDGERAEYSALYRGALEKLAALRDQQNDAQAALAVWRRLVVVDPYNSRTAIGFMRALARAGDRAAAIQHARVHAQLLQQEFGAQPDADVEAFAATLRAQAPSARVPVPAKTQLAEPAPTLTATVAESVPAKVMGTAAQTARARGRRVPATFIAAFALVFVFVAGRYAFDWFRTAPETVAVLPLPTPNEAGEHWAEISERLLDQLALREHLRVVPSSSTQPLLAQHLDAHAIGVRLGALWVVSVHTTLNQAADSLHVRIELIRARANELDWSRSYNFRLAEVLRVQDEIARDVIGVIEGHQQSLSAELPITSNPAAYFSFLEGMNELAQRTPAALERARIAFDSAVARDTMYAVAYARLAETYNHLGNYDYGSMQPRFAYEQSRAAAKRALLLEPELEVAHAALANVLFNYDWDFPGAEKEFRNALRLNRDCAPCRQWLGLLYAATLRFPQAIAQLDTATAIDRASPLAFTNRAQVQYYAAHYDSAAAVLATALDIQPDFNRAHLLLALVDFQRGHADAAVQRLTGMLKGQEEPVLLAILAYMHGRMHDSVTAERFLRRLREVSAKRYVPAEYHALAYIGAGRVDAAFEQLQEAAGRRSGGMVYLAVEPMLEPLRRDPRFTDLLHKTGH